MEVSMYMDNEGYWLVDKKSGDFWIFKNFPKFDESGGDFGECKGDVLVLPPEYLT